MPGVQINDSIQLLERWIQRSISCVSGRSSEPASRVGIYNGGQGDADLE